LTGAALIAAIPNCGVIRVILLAPRLGVVLALIVVGAP
jgi:hypothetical protein